MQEDGISETKIDARPMGFWQWLHDLGPGWPDSRGWVGVATTSITVMVLWMMAERRDLREDEFFQVIATAIILTGFVQGVIGWAYSATKGGGELADSNARIAEQAATASTTLAERASVAADRLADQPTDVNIVGQDRTVDVREDATGSTDTRTPEKPAGEAPAAPDTPFEDDAAPRSQP